MAGENIQDWSTTAANNASADSSINWAEGQTRASVNNSARSMMAAHAKQRNYTNGSITVGGTNNALTFSSGLSFASVPTGLRVLLKIALNSPGGVTTLNMDGLGAVTIKLANGNDVPANYLVAGSYAEFIYNGTNWIALDVPPLNNYVEGTITPVLSFGGASVGITYGVQQGIYTQIGRLVNFTFEITLTSKGSSTGTAAVSGLPTASAASYKHAVRGWWTADNLAYQPLGIISPAQTSIALYAGDLSLSGTYSAVALSDTSFTNTTNLIMSGQYTI